MTNSAGARLWRHSLFSALLMIMSWSASPVLADDPVRLLLMPVATDSQANGSCVRGQLFVVRSFADVDLKRGTWIADTLEIRTRDRRAGTMALADGGYVGAARKAGPESRWRIELTPGNAQLRAHPSGQADEPAIFLGRRAAKVDGACEVGSERLEDGEAVTRRLRRLLNWHVGKAEIEVLVGTGDR